MFLLILPEASQSNGTSVLRSGRAARTERKTVTRHSGPGHPLRCQARRNDETGLGAFRGRVSPPSPRCSAPLRSAPPSSPSSVHRPCVKPEAARTLDDRSSYRIFFSLVPPNLPRCPSGNTTNSNTSSRGPPTPRDDMRRNSPPPCMSTAIPPLPTPSSITVQITTTAPLCTPSTTTTTTTTSTTSTKAQRG